MVSGRNAGAKMLVGSICYGSPMADSAEAPEILLDFDGPVAIVTNNRPDKHNSFTDPSDLLLYQAFESLHLREDVKAIVWRGAGKSFSSGRDTNWIGGKNRVEDISQLELMERGHRFGKLLMTHSAPIIVEMKGWTIGGSFERALLCDLRVAGESARMMLPEVKHGVIPDTGGMARLFHMAGHGVALDLALTGRVMGAAEALQHGIVSRVVPDDQLEATVLEMAHEIAKAPAFTVKMARRVVNHLAFDAVAASIDEEALAQTLLMQSHDYDEMKAAKAEGRAPHYRRR
jgi:enoyl-CoA hydratase/carnithine racemase